MYSFQQKINDNKTHWVCEIKSSLHSVEYNTEFIGLVPSRHNPYLKIQISICLLDSPIEFSIVLKTGK